VIEVCSAFCGCTIHQLGDDGCKRCRGAKGSCGVERDTKILLVQLDAKAGLERSLEHPLAVNVENPALGEASQECLPDPDWIRTGLRAQDECLTHGGDGRADDHLIAKLGYLTCASISDVHNRRPHALEDR
jgi:hypothetical protein